MNHSYHSRLWMIVLLAFVSTAAATSCAAQERKEKTPERHGSGWIGVMISDVDQSLAEREHMTSGDGAYVREVVDDSPADSAGLKEGDVIVQFGAATIDDANDLTRAVRKSEPGTKATVTVMRNGEKISLTVTVGAAERPREFMMQVPPVAPHIRVIVGVGSLGMELQTLNDQLAEYFGAPDNTGVLVDRVEKKSAAERAGFKAGDVIIRVANHPVDDVDDVHRRLQRTEEGDKVPFEVIRKGSRKTLTLEIEKKDMEHGGVFREFGQWNNAPRWFDEDNGPMDHPTPDMKELHQNLEKMQQQLRQNSEQLRRNIRKTIRIMTTV